MTNTFNEADHPRLSGKFTDKAQTPAALTLTRDVDLADLRVGTAAGHAAITAAAGGHNMHIMRGGRTAADVDELVRQVGLAAGKHVVVVAPGTTTSDLVGAPGRPGILAEADGGILFIQDAPGQSAALLDALREPLLNGQLTVARGTASEVFDTRFQLVMTSANCPCHDEARCACTPTAKRLYWHRITGPVFDRVEITVSVDDDEEPSGITSAGAVNTSLRAAIAAEARLSGTPWKSNAEVPGDYLRGPELRLPVAVTESLDRALERGTITSRGYARVLRAAWTLADISGNETPTVEHIQKALALRRP